VITSRGTGIRQTLTSGDRSPDQCRVNGDPPTQRSRLSRPPLGRWWGISAQSMSAVEDRVSLPQFRTLVVIASLEPVNLARLAEALGVRASNATRACDHLVALGTISRAPSDRRHLNLVLTT
jgi:hypothetical protein